MKATGVVRRIDELGRIVIPKEIRKTMRIREGENMEIFTDGEERIVLKKYSAVKKLEDLALRFTDAIYAFFKYNILITDTDRLIAVSGPLKKELNEKLISDFLLQVIEKRECVIHKTVASISITEGQSYQGSYIIYPIISNGDVVGLMMILSTEEVLGEMEEKIVQIASQFLAKYLEE